MDNWEIELRDYLKRELGIIEKKVKTNFAKIFLRFACIGLLCTTAWAIKDRINLPKLPKLTQVIHRDHTEELQGLDDRFSKLEKTQLLISEDIKRLSRKVSILGIITNNTIGNLISDPCCPKDYVWINEDWTINHLPRYIKLSEEEKKKYEKFIK